MSWTPTDEQVEKAAFAIFAVGLDLTDPEQRQQAEDAWADMGGSEMDDERVGIEADARAVLVAVGPHIAAQAWEEGWGSGYVDRHRERVGDDGHVIRNEPTPNPYSEKEAGR